MNWYMRAIMAVGVFSMLSSSIVQLRLFKELSPTTLITVMAVISLFMTVVNHCLRQRAVVNWVLNNKYLVIKIELTAGACITAGMLYYGVDSTTLVVRQLVASTIMEALNASFRFLFEKVKEERQDGSYIAATKDMYTTLGMACGHILAVACITMWPNINQDMLVYAHGGIMSLGSIGLWVCLKEHDKRQ